LPSFFIHALRIMSLRLFFAQKYGYNLLIWSAETWFQFSSSNRLGRFAFPKSSLIQRNKFYYDVIFPKTKCKRKIWSAVTLLQLCSLNRLGQFALSYPKASSMI